MIRIVFVGVVGFVDYSLHREFGFLVLELGYQWQEVSIQFRYVK